MVFVHIVLIKVKPSIVSDSSSFDQLTTQLNTLHELPVAKEQAQSIKWSKPEYPERAQGYNYGLYTTFESKEKYTIYANDAEHKEFSRTKILPNVDGTSHSVSMFWSVHDNLTYLPPSPALQACSLGI